MISTIKEKNLEQNKESYKSQGRVGLAIIKASFTEENI